MILSSAYFNKLSALVLSKYFWTLRIKDLLSSAITQIEPFFHVQNVKLVKLVKSTKF